MKNIYTTALLLLTTLATLTAQAQQSIIKGKVTTSDGKPAPFVNVTIKETKKTIMADEDGSFTIKTDKECTCSIVVSYIGLKSQEKQVTIRNGQNIEVNFKLSEDAAKLEDVLVVTRKSINDKPATVGKANIAPMDMPQSTTVIGQGLLRDQQVQRLSDAIRNVNGVYLSSVRASTQETFSARGYTFSSYNMFKNGSRVNSGAMPEMSSLESVEVLKGSAAILYGQVAPGGIINMVTKKPRFNFGGEVSFRAGSYDLYKPSFDVYGPLSSSIAYRVNGTFESAKSYRDVVSSDRYYVNPSLLFKLGKKTELVIEGDYLRHNFTPDFGIGTLGGTKVANLSRSTFVGAPWQYAKTTQATSSATVRHKFNDSWQISSTLSYQNYSRDYFSIERIQADTGGNWKRPLGRTYTNENYYVGQVNLNGKFKTKGIEHNLLAGIDADRYVTTAYAYNINGTIYDSINILQPGKFTARTDIPEATRTKKGIQPLNRAGIYVQDLIKLSAKFNLLAGVRYSYVRSEAPDTTVLANNTKATGVAKTDKAFSPRLGLVYKPAATTSVFVSYSNSFAVNTGTDVYGKNLDASIIDQYEIGVKNDFFHGKLSANVTAYRIRNSNLAQTAPYLADGVTQNNNTAIKALVGQTTSDGVEVDLASHPIAGLDLIAGYSYNYMRYTNVPVAVGNYATGERLVNNPAHTANGSVFYTFNTSKIKGFRVGATAVYLGKRFGGWNSDYTLVNQKLQVRNRLIPVDGFATIDLSAGYTYNKFSVLLKISNITNTFNYYVHENYSINPIAPRQFATTLAYRF